MKFKLLILSILFTFPFKAISQIISRDTVCVGDTVSFSADTSLRHIQYCWEFGTRSITPILTTVIPVPNTTPNGNVLSVADQATMIYDTASKKFYTFVSSASINFVVPTIQRLDFGTNPNGTPTVTDLGNPFNTFINTANTNLEGIEIVKDNQDIYHAFIANGGIVHLVFGNGIANPPTQSVRIYSNRSILTMAMQLEVIHYNNQWVLFAGQAYGPAAIVRLDLGADLNNIPATIPETSLTIPGGYWPCYFAIIKEANNWHMFFADLIYTNTALRRFDFGPNLQNNAPILNNLGTFTPQIVACRGLSIIKSCDTFYMLELNENGDVLSFDFKNNITGVPTSRSLGILYNSSVVNMEMFKPYWYNDTLWALSTNYYPNAQTAVYRFPLLGIPHGNAVIKYWSADASHVFNTPGTYNVTLYCDQADPRGPESFCKQVVVLPTAKNFLGPDTLLCGIPSYIIDAGAPGLSNWIWSTAQTTPAITVTHTGTYNVQAYLGKCLVKDTITVDFENKPVVNLGADQQVCSNQTTVLGPGGSFSNPIYKWNTGQTSPQIQVSNTGSYILTVNSNGCSSSDTVLINVRQAPNANLGNDTAICTIMLPLTLMPHNIPAAGTTYQWSNSTSAAQMQVTQGGSYWLVLTANSCSDTDTVVVTATPVPVVNLGSDKTICANQILLLGPGGSFSNPVYTWSTGAVAAQIQVSRSGSYILTVNSNGCQKSDTIIVTVNPVPNADLGDDTTVCVSALPLTLMPHNIPATGTTYQWDNGTSASQMQIAQGGSFWLVLTANSCSDTDTIVVTAIADPQVDLGIDSIICAAKPLKIGAEITGATYNWNTGASSPYISVSETGNYILSVDLSGCIVSDTIQIAAMPSPEVNLDRSRNICSGKIISLDATSPDSVTYLWSTNATTPVNNVTEGGVYWVRVTSKYNCTTTDTVIVSQLLPPGITLGDDTVVCENNPLTLYASVTGVDSVQWADGSMGRSLIVTNAGTFIASAFNECGIASDTIIVNQIPCDIWLPDAFTPNGDGKNDRFRILGDVVSLTKVRFNIYNKWGNLVFTTQDKFEGWDGKYKGRDEMLDSYYYYLQYEKDGQSYTLKGNLTLIR